MTLASTVALAVLGVAVVTVLFVRFRLLGLCPRCGGWGMQLLAEREPCWVCGGTGSFRVPDALPAEWAAADEIALDRRGRE